MSHDGSAHPGGERLGADPQPVGVGMQRHADRRWFCGECRLQRGEGELVGADGTRQRVQRQPFDHFGLTEQQIGDAAALDPVQFVQGGLAAELVAAGALELDAGVAEVFTTTSELRRQVGTDTVAVLIRPS